MIKRLIFIFLTLFLAGFTPYAQLEEEEYNLKAAFTYKFTNYIDWDSLIPGDEFIIGIIGSSPIKSELMEIAGTKTVNGKKIIISEFSKTEEIGTCHILFISQKTSLPLDEILAKAARKGTLTISEKRGYAARGAAINFILVNHKLKFEANPKAIRTAGLMVSSQLLKLAIIVE